MQRISLTIREAPKVNKLLLLSILQLGPYLGACLRMDSSITVSIDGPDDVIQDLKIHLSSYLPDSILKEIKYESQP